jgi:hypothetical protein
LSVLADNQRTSPGRFRFFEDALARSSTAARDQPSAIAPGLDAFSGS